MQMHLGVALAAGWLAALPGGVIAAAAPAAEAEPSAACVATEADRAREQDDGKFQLPTSATTGTTDGRPGLPPPALQESRSLPRQRRQSCLSVRDLSLPLWGERSSFGRSLDSDGLNALGAYGGLWYRDPGEPGIERTWGALLWPDSSIKWWRPSTRTRVQVTVKVVRFDEHAKKQASVRLRVCWEAKDTVDAATGPVDGKRFPGAPSSDELPSDQKAELPIANLYVWVEKDNDATHTPLCSRYPLTVKDTDDDGKCDGDPVELSVP